MADYRKGLLIGAYVLAIAWLAYELLRPAPTLPEPPAAETEPVQQFQLPKSVFGNVNAFDAILERPLFSQSRKADEPDEISEEPVVEVSENDTRSPPPQIRLSAVFAMADGVTALIEKENGETEAFQVGARYDDWRITEILDDQMVLTSGGQRHTLNLFEFDSLPTQASPARRLSIPSRRPRVLPTRRPPNAAASSSGRASAGNPQDDSQ